MGFPIPPLFRWSTDTFQPSTWSDAADNVWQTYSCSAPHLCHRITGHCCQDWFLRQGMSFMWKIILALVDSYQDWVLVSSISRKYFPYNDIHILCTFMLCLLQDLQVRNPFCPTGSHTLYNIQAGLVAYVEDIFPYAQDQNRVRDSAYCLHLP